VAAWAVEARRCETGPVAALVSAGGRDGEQLGRV
jgi:hypothetical protein